MSGSSARTPFADGLSEPQAGAGFLAEASRLLADSLDYEGTLATVARLSLPYLGAWCIVDLCIDGRMKRAAVVHTDPEMEGLARRLANGWPPDGDDPLGIPRAVRTRRTEVIREIPDDELAAAAHGDENLRILRALGVGSLLIVPLTARGNVLGAITYVSPRDGRPHGAADVALAEDLAARCAIALDNARLYRASVEAQRKAEEASAARTQFLAVMSHELRTPLTAVVAFAELLETEVLGPVRDKQREALQRIMTNSWHLVGIIDEVLVYSRAEAGKLELREEETDLARIVEEVGVVLSPEAQRSGIALEVEPAREPALLRTDPGKVRQILYNLIGNAIKYTGEGGVHVWTGRNPEQPPTMFVRIHDTGPGIDGAERERIFEPFTQGDNYLTRTAGGMGLGLSISRKLARLLGGDITLESTPGEGSTFTLHLPVRS